MNAWAFLVAGTAVAILTIWIRSHRRLRCSCPNPWWAFQPHHERTVVMVGMLVYALTGLGVCVAAGWRVGAIVWLLVVWSEAYRIWKHEKGRRDRAAKGIGRVITDLHGRLKVVPA